MKRPLIVLSPNILDKVPSDKLCNNASYYQAVTAAGGLPVTCGDLDEETAAALAERCDGLLMTGGVDVDPHRYTEQISELSSYEPRIDDINWFLLEAFRKAGKPIFGICRGLQVINVFFGGTLIQDIPTMCGLPETKHNMHRWDPPVPSSTHAHTASFTKGSLLYEILGKECGFNSFHHQAVKDVAPGLKVTGTADDGIVEGLEGENVFAVQWHPERMIAEEKQLDLFRKFIEMCQ